MGTVIQLKKQINNSYFDLKNSVEEKLILVEEKIKNKLSSEVDLVKKISDYQRIKLSLFDLKDLYLLSVEENDQDSIKQLIIDSNETLTDSINVRHLNLMNGEADVKRLLP